MTITKYEMALGAIMTYLMCILNVAAPSPKWAGHMGPPKTWNLWAHDNLLAWCVVPFDAKNRGPEERAKMLAKLGFTKFAYDWRPVHVPTFDTEIAALNQHGIHLEAWWFPFDAGDLLPKRRWRSSNATTSILNCGLHCPGEDRPCPLRLIQHHRKRAIRPMFG